MPTVITRGVNHVVTHDGLNETGLRHLLAVRTGLGPGWPADCVPYQQAIFNLP